MKTWVQDKLRNFKSDCKRIHKSLTMWFSGVTTALVGSLLGLPIEQIAAFVPTLQPYLADEKFRQAMLIVLAVNFVFTLLRFKTSKALRDK